MTNPLYNPGQPYLLPVPSGFSPGKVAHLTGTFSLNAANLVLKFQSGPYGDPNDEVGLCMYGRLNEGILGLNTFTRAAGWGQEMVLYTQGFVKGQPFEVTVLCEPHQFKVAVNQQHAGEFPHRMNPALLNHLNIVSGANDITISCIWIEDPTGGVAPPPPPAQAPYPAPPMGPVDPYYQQQQSYAPQNAGFVPGAPSSGGKSGKGLMGMVGSAGAAVAGALGASHLLGKSKGYNGGPQYGGGYPGNPQHGGGYPGGQPQYGGGYPGGGQPQYGGAYPGGGQPQYGGYPGQPQQYGQSQKGGGLMDKAMGLGGGLLGAKAMSKGMGGSGGGGASKALKYGLAGAGAGAGAYMLSKGLGSSFSFDCSGSDDSDSD